MLIGSFLFAKEGGKLSEGWERRKETVLALSRRTLKAMGIDEEKIDEIIALHTETVDGLKADIAKYKEDAENAGTLKQELDDLKAQTESVNDDGWEEKYNSLKSEFEGYKAEQEAKELHTAKEAAYQELLKTAGVSEKRLAAVLRVSDIDNLELEDDGTVKDADKLMEGIKSEWADFIVSQETKGADTATPAANNAPEETRTSRAAQIAADYHKNLYGVGKETV